VGSVELPAIPPDRRPKIDVFDFSFTNKLTVRRIWQILANIWLIFTNKCYSLAKQANNLTNYETNQMETS
jgi:hypothetical protein